MATVKINKEFYITILLAAMIIIILRQLDKELILFILAFPLFKGIYDFLIWLPEFWKYA